MMTSQTYTSLSSRTFRVILSLVVALFPFLLNTVPFLSEQAYAGTASGGDGNAESLYVDCEKASVQELGECAYSDIFREDGRNSSDWDRVFGIGEMVELTSLPEFSSKVKMFENSHGVAATDFVFLPYYGSATYDGLASYVSKARTASASEDGMPEEQLSKISADRVVMLFKDGRAFLVGNPAIAFLVKNAVAENPGVLAFHVDKASFSENYFDVLVGCNISILVGIIVALLGLSVLAYPVRTVGARILERHRAGADKTQELMKYDKKSPFFIGAL